jgi:hypothetical protein
MGQVLIHDAFLSIEHTYYDYFTKVAFYLLAKCGLKRK